MAIPSKSRNKGRVCFVLPRKPWDSEDCILCPNPSAGRILRNIPRLSEPVGRDFGRSEVMHSPLCKRGHSSETGLLGAQTAHSVLGSHNAVQQKQCRDGELVRREMSHFYFPPGGEGAGVMEQGQQIKEVPRRWSMALSCKAASMHGTLNSVSCPE